MLRRKKTSTIFKNPHISSSKDKKPLERNILGLMSAFRAIITLLAPLCSQIFIISPYSLTEPDNPLKYNIKEFLTK